MSLFNQIASLNAPVNDPKLSDFTVEELKAAYVAINVYLEFTPESPLRQHLELFSVQLVNASAVVQFRENTLSN